MKKLLIVLVALAFVLSACGSAATTQAPATAAPATAAPATAAPATAAPVVAPTATPAPVPHELTVATSDFWMVHGSTIDTDDAAAMTTWGELETLTKIGPDGKMVPCLALSWTLKDDTTWEFKLRQDVKFSNGEPFNAKAVVNSLNYIKNSPTPPRGFTKTTFDSITAVDDYTVDIKTAAHDALMPDRLSNTNTGILAPSAYTAASGPVNFFNTATGPFILKDFVADQSMTLVKNPNYWGGKVALDKVTVLLVPDPKVRATMVQTGEADLAIHLPLTSVSDLNHNPDVKLYQFTQPRANTLYMNMSRAPFSDIKLRQAVSYAIDKQALVDAVLEGIGTPATGPFASYEAWANPDVKGTGFDAAKATELLTAAGYTTKKPLKVELLTYSDRVELPGLAVAIQGMLSNVGIAATVRIAPYASVAPDVLAGNFDMFILSRSHLVETYDPSGFFIADYSCKGTNNMAHFCDPTFDAQLAKAPQSDDSAARAEIYKQLEAQLDSQVASVWLNYTSLVNGSNLRLLNYTPYPLERFVILPDLDVTPK